MVLLPQAEADNSMLRIASRGSTPTSTLVEEPHMHLASSARLAGSSPSPERLPQRRNVEKYQQKRSGLYTEEIGARSNSRNSDEEETRYVYADLDERIPRSSFRVRIRGFTFAWFTLCMATGGLAILLGRIPDAYRFTGLRTLGEIVFVIDLVLFVAVHSLLAVRFYLHPPAFKSMLLHPVESSYICGWLQACATIIVAIEIYGFQHCGYWLVKTALVLWAIDSFLAVALSIYLPVVHFLGHPHGHKEMPPSFMLLPTIVIYTATVAYGVIDQVPVYTGIWVLWVSYALLGFGIFLFIFYLALWFMKLVSGGLHDGKQALTPYMIVGMTSYTAGGLFGLGEQGLRLFPQYNTYTGRDYMPSSGSVNGLAVYGAAGSTFHMFNLSLGILFYGFTWWCILVSTTMSFHVWRQGRASPSLSAMLSTAFPTTGLIIDTWDIARNLGITGLPSGVRWLDIVGIVLLFIWILAYVAGIAGITNKIWKGRLLWEGLDDNAPEFGYMGEFKEVKKEDQAPEGA